MSRWLFLSILFEFAVFVISVIFYRTLKENKLGTFPYFLFFVVTGELTGYVLAKMYQTNIAFYNVFTTLQIAYYLLLLSNSIESAKAKRVLLIFMIFFIIASVINYFFIQDISNELVSYTFTIGCLLITMGASYFFYELIQSNIIENYTTYPLFWIVLGLFIFYVCNIPYMSVYNYLSRNYKTVFGAYFKIIECLTYIMYSFFIIGIICSSRRKSHLH
jgi:hypothetical protein